MSNAMKSSEGSTPVPDPTILTTELTRREISALRELLEARLAGMDQAITLTQKTSDQIPAVVAEKVQHLRELNEEKFRSIATQFIERDIRTEQTARDSKVAVDAALQAQKEAAGAQNESNAASISKSEAAFTKQIDQIGVIIATTSKGADEKIDDLKTRLTAVESRKDEHQKGTDATFAYVAAIIGVVGMVATIITLVVLLVRH